jgi:N-acyl-D-aspartate/D-glutamate deacylase
MTDSSSIVIRNGTVVDGTGNEPFEADVLIEQGHITEVGRGIKTAARAIEAEGSLVTPGWVDIHTHYDGQLTWDPLLRPSCWHGVTTAITGNCGVGFAPVRPGEHGLLVEMMESTEDIPARCLEEAIKWDWETFPEYMDSVSSGQYALDIGLQVSHAALRYYVMGQRGADNEPATHAESKEMARLTAEAIQKGALGFSFSRTKAHTYRDGWQPGTLSDLTELEPIASAIADVGGAPMMFSPRGVTGMFPDERNGEMELAAELSNIAKSPVMMCLIQHSHDPQEWQKILDWMSSKRLTGTQVFAQVTGRSIVTLGGLATKFNPFMHSSAWEELANLPCGEVARKISEDSVLRNKLITDADATRHIWQTRKFFEETTYPLVPLGENFPNYEPSESIADVAVRLDKPALEVMMDVLCSNQGMGILNYPHYNYVDGNLEAVREMLLHPNTRLGLSDAGAHLETLSDASLFTFMLTHWARDREEGIPLPTVVKMMTSEPADMFGLGDRGRIAPGLRADINVIDYLNLDVGIPWLENDVPAGGSRLLQKPDGYKHTFVSGVETFRDGEATGEFPGRLVKRGGLP